MENINYRLWFYPYEYYYIGSPEYNRHLENYINKPIDGEIRVYKDMKEVVYVHTDITEPMAIIKYNDEFVYGFGFLQKDGYLWPIDLENYEVIDRFSFVIPEPHKPNYGTSESKDEIIAAIEEYVDLMLDDHYRYSKKWANTEVYIADFYEYEGSTGVFLILADGSIRYSPVAFEYIKGKLETYGGKGFDIEASRINEYEKYMTDAVRHYIWNP